MRLTTALLFVVFSILVFGQDEKADPGDPGEPDTTTSDGGDSLDDGRDCFDLLNGPDNPNSPDGLSNDVNSGEDGGKDSGEHSLTISGTTIYGDVIVDGSTGHKVHITDSTINGNLYFVNGCSIYNDMIHECDGSKRKMQKNERIKLRKRIAYLRKHQKAKVGGKVKSHKKKHPEVKGRHMRLAHKHQKSKGRKHHKNTHALHNHAAHVPGKFSPCTSCHENQHSEEPEYEEATDGA